MDPALLAASRPSAPASPSSRSPASASASATSSPRMVSSVARNPGARDAVFPIGILGFALTEAVALFALLIAFLILFT